MYAAIRQGKVKPGTAEETARLAREGALPMIQASPGFKGYYFVASEDNTVTIVTLFDTQDAAEASSQAALGWIREHLAQYLDGQPNVSLGRVLVHHEV